jgi:hypothetical protein
MTPDPTRAILVGEKVKRGVFQSNWLKVIIPGCDNENPTTRYSSSISLSLGWYGHVLRKGETDWVKRNMDVEVEGIQGRGRPKLTWREVVRRLGLNEGEAENRSQWRKKIKGHGNLGLNPGDVPGCPRVLQGGVPLNIITSAVWKQGNQF